MSIHLRLMGVLLLFAVHASHGIAPYTGMPYDPAIHKRSAVLTFFASSDDYLFEEGETIRLTAHSTLRPLDASWTLCRNTLKTPLLRGPAELKLGSRCQIEIPTAELPPGFYDLHLTVMVGEGISHTAVTTFGWKHAEAPIPMLRPDDFEAFWRGAAASLRELPPAVSRTAVGTFDAAAIAAQNLERSHLPAHPDPAGERHEQVELYKIEFDSTGGQRIHAWYAKPAGDGPFPGLLMLPGAGNRYRPAPLEHARHGFATLDIQVHGEPVDLPNEQYSRQRRAPDTTLEASFDYGIYLHALQAVNVLAAMPEVDPERLAVAGGSQGGRLAIVVAALDPRIKAAVPTITHFAWRPYIWWAEACNRRGTDGRSGVVLPEQLTDAQRRESYLDVLNFAPMVSCPVMMNAGLVDYVSPASTVYALYRQLGSDEKQILPMPDIGHDVSMLFDRMAWRWLEQQLQVVPLVAE